MRSERKKQIYLHFSEPQGGKACKAGLKRTRRCGARAEGKLVCTMPSREEEKPAKQG